ncbi:MAG: hypothetical protein ACQEXJ_20115 [Myxococcota bacterium]
MGETSAVKLRVVAAETRAELTRIDRTIDELAHARDALRAAADGETEQRLALYASAALLETLYTGVEKVLRRIGAATTGVPEGASWHRDLLDAMTVDVPRVRPAVLSTKTALLLERYLAFRHRFRNLYLFDLEVGLLSSLLEDAPAAWKQARAELEQFVATLEHMADEMLAE